MIYKAKVGARISAHGAQVLGSRFEELASSGPLTPAEVVADATDEASPIHSYFQWDDRKAGESYRLHQAGYYLRNIEVQVERENADTLQVRAFHVVNIPAEKDEDDVEPDRGYMTYAEVISDASLLDQVIEQERARLRICQTHLRQYAALSRAADAVGVALREMVLA